jgi:excisionase family DNA binding protein
MDLLTIEETAALLKVPRTWLYARTCKSSDLEPLPFYRFGRLIRFKREEIVNWMERQHQSGPRSAGSQPEGQAVAPTIQ